MISASAGSHQTSVALVTVGPMAEVGGVRLRTDRHVENELVDAPRVSPQSVSELERLLSLEGRLLSMHKPVSEGYLDLQDLLFLDVSVERLLARHAGDWVVRDVIKVPGESLRPALTKDLAQ